MKLLAVIMSLLILTTGCVAGESAQPVVQPQVTVEQPTYQGITQYDYKAGAPGYTIVDNTIQSADGTVQTDNTTQATPTVPSQPASSLPYLITGGGGGGGYWPPYYYTPPAPKPQPVVILSGSVTVTITGEE
jgi:hypothetical protein